MMHRCPKCREATLTPADRRASRALRCTQCKGTWLPRAEARRNAVAALLSCDSTLLPGRGPDAKSGLCPEGHAILTRARVEVKDPFHVERCAECLGLWLDKGEWTRLWNMGLVDEIDRLFQGTVRLNARTAEELERELGTPLYESLLTVANALSEQRVDLRKAALGFLNREVEARTVER